MAFATGDGSAAFGSSTASGLNAFAAGSQAIASGSNSAAFGGSNSATGTASLVGGGQAFASGNYSLAWGTSVTASGQGSQAFGGGNIASGFNSSAFGGSSLAQGDSSFALGSTTSAYGLISFAGGYFSRASGETSFAHSYLSNADAAQSAILAGRSNWVQSGATHSAILGGSGNTLTNAATNSVILGCSDITGTTPDTIYGCNIDVNNIFSGGTNLNSIFSPIGGDVDAIHDNVANEITAITEKTSVDNQDEFILEDSEDSFNKKSIKRINIVRPISNIVADTATLTPNSDETDQESITGLTQTLTINAPTGSPTDGQKLIIRIEDDGTTRTLTWNVNYEVIGVTLPTATTANKKIYVGCIYNSTDATWDVVAVNVEA